LNALTVIDKFGIGGEPAAQFPWQQNSMGSSTSATVLSNGDYD